MPSFTPDKDTEREMLEENVRLGVYTRAEMYALQKGFGVYNNAEVIRKVIAFAKVAVLHADENGVLTIAGSSGPITVALRD